MRQTSEVCPTLLKVVLPIELFQYFDILEVFISDKRVYIHKHES